MKLHVDFIWIAGPDGNIQHIAEHGIVPAEAEEVVQDPIATTASATSGRQIAFGFTSAGRKLAVVYEEMDAMTVYVITAFDVK